LHGEEKLLDLIDPTLILSEDEKIEVQRLIKIALLCSQAEAEQRPTMARVVAMLQHDTESEVVVVSCGCLHSAKRSLPRCQKQKKQRRQRLILVLPDEDQLVVMGNI
jgi:hypothetical protein